MSSRCTLPFVLFVAGLTAVSRAQFRPPAVPLVTSDPYLSIWSEADRLTDDVTRHWTHHPHSLVSLIRVDGRPYRLMGSEPKSVPALPQVGLSVTPTKTTYQFAGAGVSVELGFLTPLIPSDLDVLSRPVTYISWRVRSSDHHDHRVQIYDSASSQLAVESEDQAVVCQRVASSSLTMMRVGTVAQTFLRPQGDDTRIDWGYAYLAAPRGAAASAIGLDADVKASFVATGKLPAKDGGFSSRPVADGQPVLALAFDLGNVGGKLVERHGLIGYDEIDSIEYFGQKLPPYWRRHGMTAPELFATAERDYPRVSAEAMRFDRELTTDLTQVGGAKYAQICALAYRECMAANGLAADKNGQPLFLTKENTSNGDIATVDVFFPMDPMLILLSPSLAKASLVSNFDYAASSHWKFPNAPHDLGTYPRAFGRDDGGEGMPVEESGNMILLTDAIAHAEGNPKFASRYWKQLTQWATYLEKYGLDPEDQLCTDDFMGHLAHNANLSVKAILALGAYGDLCDMRGDRATARRYRDLAHADALHWMKVADAGDRSLLAFDKPGTWSQKYNLVWDRILGLNVFPPSVAAKEIAFYKTVMQPYGLPLDSRTHLTKTDWTIWSATLAEKKSDFEFFIDPIYEYVNHTTTRDPIADSYMTDNVKSGGMHARPVVGGFFIKMLSDRAIWRKWASRDRANVGNWAPLPKPPVIDEIVPTSRKTPQVWRYTTQRPAPGWMKPGFDDGLWQSGPGGLGTPGTPGIEARTPWNTDDIWIRRTFKMPLANPAKLKLLLYHDEDAEVYINGVPAATEAGYTTEYSVLDIAPAALKQLGMGANVVIAIHCHQTSGGQGVDAGLGMVRG